MGVVGRPKAEERFELVVPCTRHVGDFEVADWMITEGAHLAESAETFAIMQVGYTNVTSYAYPGGLRLKVINPQKRPAGARFRATAKFSARPAPASRATGV